MLQDLVTLWESTGIAKFFDHDILYFGKTMLMYLIVGVLVYLAIAAYSYMALIPMIQPPIMKLCTTKKERTVRMT